MTGVEDHALALYQVLRVRGRANAQEIGKAAGLDDEQTARGLRRLGELGLVQDRDGRLEPVEPDTALVRTMDAYHADAAEQVLRATTMQRATQALMTVYRPAVAREASEVEVEYLSDRRRKDRGVVQLNATTREYCDSLHPGAMPPMHVLGRSLAEDAAMIERGVRVRAIYRQDVTQTPRYARYLRELAETGAEVRLIDHAAFDMLIVDGLVACLPANPDDRQGPMVVIRGTSLVNVCVALYADYWLRAVPFEAAASGTDDRTELTPQERVVIRLMAGGLSDDQIARKMGVHRRTVQRAIAKLMERLQADSRFEAGLKLAQDREFARALRPGPAGPSLPLR
jgi:DNA-binding CsgD family transcriptional regulator